MALTTEQVQKLADTLQGSASSIEAETERLFDLSEDDLSTENHRQLDGLVFCCTACDWWFEASEMSDDPEHDWECRECAEESNG